MSDEEIIKLFQLEYHRTPSYREFKLLGGKCSRGVYPALIKILGYPKPTHAITLQVVNTRNQVVYEGTVKDLAEEYDRHPAHIRNCATKNYRLLSQYTVREKEVKLEYLIKAKEEGIYDKNKNC